MPRDAIGIDGWVTADQVEGRLRMALADEGECLDHRLAALALPIDPDEEEPRPAPVPRRPSPLAVAAEPDDVALGVGDAIVVLQGLRDPLAGDAATVAALISASLTVLPA